MKACLKVNVGCKYKFCGMVI